MAGVVLVQSCGGSTDTTNSTASPSITADENGIVGGILVIPQDSTSVASTSTTTTSDTESLETDRTACFNSLAVVQRSGGEVQLAVDAFDTFGNPYVSVFSKLQRDLDLIAASASSRVSAQISAMSDLMGTLYDVVLNQDDYGYERAIQESETVSSRLLYACAEVGATCPDGRDIALADYNCE